MVGKGYCNYNRANDANDDKDDRGEDNDGENYCSILSFLT